MELPMVHTSSIGTSYSPTLTASHSHESTTRDTPMVASDVNIAGNQEPATRSEPRVMDLNSNFFASPLQSSHASVLAEKSLRSCTGVSSSTQDVYDDATWTVSDHGLGLDAYGDLVQAFPNMI
ncbi:hypothetical protein V6N13_096863 [Hibiscus sabdariffa]|uniref:Uncharacterized protein n=1 Tax=Hibiscus sabdariffa TaxID=183260 RepID=A0ABR2C8R4_9ROSI